MPSATSPQPIHPKILAALDQFARLAPGGAKVALPVVIVTDRSPDGASLPGISPTLVTWPDGKTRVQGSAEAKEAAAGAAGGGRYQFHVTLQLEPGRRAAAEEFLTVLASAPGVSAIKPAEGLRPDLHYSVPEVRARRQRDITNYPNNYDAATDTSQDGTDVIVGVVDFGLDFAHPNFITSNGSTRVLAIWDQNSYSANPYPPPDAYKPVSTGPLWYGETSANTLYANSRVYLRGQLTLATGGFPPASASVTVPAFLNAQIGATNPYANYYDPHANYFLTTASPDDVIAHGTHVADIAAGNGRATNCHSGVAPKADIVFVQVRKPDLSTWKVSAADVLNAVYFIFTFATKFNKPAVVNVSMNLYSGPHDGSGPWESTLSALVKNDADANGGSRLLPRMVVVSAGNAYGMGQHARFVLDSKDEDSIRWTFPAGDTTDNYLTLWYNCANDAADKLVITVRNRKLISGGEAVQNFGSPASAVDIKSKVTSNPVIGTIETRDNLGSTSKRSVRITIKPLADAVMPTGARRFVDVILKWDANLLKRVHGWIERDDLTGQGAGQSFFAGGDREDQQKQLDLQQTLGDIACGANIIAVGAINAPTDAGPDQGPPERALLAVSSAGPPVDYSTLDDGPASKADAGFAGSQQPWVVAPGVAVAAALSKGGQPVPGPDPRPMLTILSGTSMAAPHVTGAVAILLQKNKDGAATKGYAEIKAALRDGVFHPSGSWDNRYGHGRLDVLGAHGKLVV